MPGKSSGPRIHWKTDAVDHVARSLISFGRRKASEILKSGIGAAATYTKDQIASVVRPRRAARDIKQKALRTGSSLRARRAVMIISTRKNSAAHIVRFLEDGYWTVTTGRYIPGIKKRLKTKQKGGKIIRSLPRRYRRKISFVPGTNLVEDQFNSISATVIKTAGDRIATRITAEWSKIGRLG